MNKSVIYVSNDQIERFHKLASTEFKGDYQILEELPLKHKVRIMNCELNDVFILGQNMTEQNKIFRQQLLDLYGSLSNNQTIQETRKLVKKILDEYL
ncbi:MAG: hypothetical protein Wins2KO_04000 [Winogradskyella sp.]